MAAFAALHLNNGTVDITFSPMSIDQNGIARWESYSTYLSARTQVTSSITNVAKSKVIRPKQKIVFPIADPVDPALVLGEIVCNIDTVIPKFCTSNHRTAFYNYLKDLVADDVMSNAIVNGENVY